MKYIAKFHLKLYTDTPLLARLKSGFLIKKIFDCFTQKMNSTLKPDRSLFLYSAHDVTIANLLNSLGLFEVRPEIANVYKHGSPLILIMNIFSTNNQSATFPTMCIESASWTIQNHGRSVLRSIILQKIQRRASAAIECTGMRNEVFGETIFGTFQRDHSRKWFRHGMPIATVVCIDVTSYDSEVYLRISFQLNYHWYKIPAKNGQVKQTISYCRCVNLFY